MHSLHLPALRKLAGTYLYQSWQHEFDDVDEAVRAYLRDEPARDEDLAGDVRTLLSAADTESELDAWLVDAGADYLPSDDGWTYQAWLAHVAEIAEQHVAQNSVD
ncbi:contact-dependent growth inhibition system immunity protein [Nocardioides sp. Leaf307]|uniref:contact-dependent growth inhibition system immunity protein n=1 Tax=Nocardioides sp. Leaf307 TaxID=1736331 RepID=UPI0007027FF7|nr:contact-dependent growth inhibition system immunity protein [Nocardioides sp. Leaf307]KQQ42064.1 hypothetical protein ASF50_14500 [Nocardioides sp. Leaf307]